MQYFESNRPMQTLIPALRNIIISPKPFFSGLPPAAFYSNSIFFISILVFGASFIGVPFRDMSLLFLLPVSWGLTLIGIKFWASYLSWALRFFAKVKLTTANAFQLSAYAGAPMLLTAIPGVGILAYVWNLYLLWIALTHRCKIRSGMAVLIIAIPAVIFATFIAVVLTFSTQVFPQLGYY